MANHALICRRWMHPLRPTTSTPACDLPRLYRGDEPCPVQAAARALGDRHGDVVQSTKAIAENRYKAVNMAGAAVIVAVTNALDDRDFPFVFGGDGASFAVPAEAAAPARQALAETAAWVKEDST